jgi:hypothetical protein
MLIAAHLELLALATFQGFVSMLPVHCCVQAAQGTLLYGCQLLAGKKAARQCRMFQQHGMHSVRKSLAVAASNNHTTTS